MCFFNLQINVFNIYDCNMLAKITKTVSTDNKSLNKGIIIITVSP